jgi:Domain of unknown function (DUF3943)
MARLMGKILRPRPAVTALVCALLISAAPAAAQETEPSFLARAIESASLFEQPSPAPDPYANARPCAGCPPRGVGRAFLQTTVVNVFYGLANLARGQVTARVTPKTWWENMENGWVWDLDDFVVNQIGHPYQGSNYYNAGRANGLSFYESAAIAAFGSATWEYYGETNKASLNDFINTTLGGIAIGEVLHRVAWLVRDPSKSGSGRLWNEIGATVLDPVTGYNRFRRGDASRIAEKPADMMPAALSGFMSAGALWRGTEHEPFEGSAQAFLETDLLYGDVLQGRSRTPYDAFAMTLRFGGGSAVSEARLLGRLLGEPLGDSGKFQFTVAQSYDFQLNDAYSFGAQSFDAGVAFTHPLSSRFGLSLIGSGGLTVLGAIDSLPVGVEEVPEEEEEEPTGGQGVSEGPRFYDYGPGSKFTLRALFLHDRVPFAVAFYEGRQLYSLDGLRANHFLQHARLDLRVPIYRPIGFGVAAEYFFRHTYYQDVARTERMFRYPQFRTYLTWNIS